MGVTHYIACNDCEERIYAGKYLFDIKPDMLDEITEFPESPSSGDIDHYVVQEKLLYILRGFLVKHSGHNISYFNDTDSEYEETPMWKYQEVVPW